MQCLKSADTKKSRQLSVALVVFLELAHSRGDRYGMKNASVVHTL